MTIERLRPPDEPAPDDAPRLRPSPDLLDELHHRASQHSQAARDAIARIIGSGNPEQQLRQLKNQGGQ
jgi:hypothetical protein